MATHYHAIVETPRANLSDAMRQLNGVFTERTNRSHQRSGHLFGERFSSAVIERDRYLRRVSICASRQRFDSKTRRSACLVTCSMPQMRARLSAT
jgi:hypothetical protein